MKPSLFAVLVSSLLLAGHAMADTKAADTKGDPKIGKMLVSQKCSRCHDDSVYSRPDHMIKSYDALVSRIRACNTNTNAGLFPDDEAHIAAYLNLTYYHFKK